MNIMNEYHEYNIMNEYHFLRQNQSSNCRSILGAACFANNSSLSKRMGSIEQIQWPDKYLMEQFQYKSKVDPRCQVWLHRMVDVLVYSTTTYVDVI